MATLLVYACIKQNNRALIPLAILIGFALDILIAYSVAEILK